MWSLITQVFFWPFSMALLAALTIWILGIYARRLLLRHKMRQTSIGQKSSFDVTPIAGDDTHATCLDIARAYVEMGQAELAKEVLAPVLQQGSTVQKAEALALLQTCRAF